MSSGRQILGIVGTVVGAFFGGPVGASIGGIIGGELGGLIDGPPEGPKLEDLSAPAIQYGAKVPWVEGTVWCELSPLWWSGLRQSSETVGGKGGDSGVEQFVYHCDMYGRLANGANVIAWTRIEIDGEIVATRLASSSAESIANGAVTDRYSDVVLLPGVEGQTPWPVYEAAVGTSNASAYLGQCTIGFQNLWMRNGRQPSRIRVEVITSGTSSAQGDGLLCHFDEASGGYVTSALGPDMQQGGDAALAGSDPVWSGHGTGGPGDSYFSADGITGNLTGRAWRVEFFFTPASGWLNLFEMKRLTSPAYEIELLRGGVFEALSWSATTDLGTGGGALGDPMYTPTIGVRNHCAIQYDPADGLIWVFLNGTRISSLPFAAGELFSDPGVTFERIRLLQAEDVDYDEIYYQLEPEEMYGATYVVPTAPFVARNVTVWTPGAEDLQDVLERMALRCRPLTAGNIDFSAAAGKLVYGYKYFGSAAASMQPLLTAHYLDMFCDDKLRLVQRGGSIEQTVAFAWSGAGGGDKFAGLVRDNDVEVRKRTAITYINRLSDGETDTVNGERESVGVETETVTLAIYMTRSVAQGIADTATWDKRVATHTATVRVGARHGLLIQPGSVVMFTDHKGNSYRTLVRRAVLDGWVWSLEVRLDDPGILMAAGIAVDADLRVIEVATPPEASLLLVDGPMVRDADDSPGFMAVITVTGERTDATLYGSADNVTFSAIGSVSRSATTGRCTALGNHTAGWLWDEVNPMTVTLDGDNMTLASSTRAAMYANERINCAWVIHADGMVELIRFRTATLIAPRTYLLSGFLRGLKGTEFAIGGHADGDTFVLLADNGMLSVVQEAGDIGALRYYKAVPPGRSPESVTAQEFTSYSERIKPRAPVNLRASLVGSTAVVTFDTRSRFSVPPYAEPPLGEAVASYRAEMLNGSTVVDSQIVSDRTVTFTGASAGYTVSIAQRSAIVGDGHESEITL